jgi:phosphoribosyl 1,2-cyclic phosphodiesterase
MKITLAGVRGTTPTADAAHAEFGGETSCCLIQGNAGDAIIVDGGSGLRVAEAAIGSSCPTKRALLLLTHYHADHTIGLPPFRLLHDDKWSFDIAAPVLDGRTVETVFPRLFEEPFWPVSASSLKAAIRLKTLQPGEPVVWGGLVCRWCKVHHPGGCAAYRVDEPATGRSVVIATDLEWDLSTAAEQQAFEQLCGAAPLDALIWDGHFTPQNYDRFRGWGHSRWSDGVDAARRVNAAQLLITHHAPGHDDSALETIARELRAAMPQAKMARQGETLKLESWTND